MMIECKHTIPKIASSEPSAGATRDNVGNTICRLPVWNVPQTLFGEIVRHKIKVVRAGPLHGILSG